MSRVPGGKAGGDFQGLALAGTVVGELVVPILIGLWLDNRYGWSPWGVSIGTVVGFVGTITHMLILGRRKDTTGRPPPAG